MVDGKEPVSTSDLLAVLGKGGTMPVVLFRDPTATIHELDGSGVTYDVALSQPVDDFTAIIVCHFSAEYGMGGYNSYHDYIQAFPRVLLDPSNYYKQQLQTVHTMNGRYEETTLPITASGSTLQVTIQDEWRACIFMVIGMK